MKRIETGLSNYYGEVKAVERDGKYYLELDNWTGPEEIEISQNLFEAIEKEFSKGENVK